MRISALKNNKNNILKVISKTISLYLHLVKQANMLTDRQTWSLWVVLHPPPNQQQGQRNSNEFPCLLCFWPTAESWSVRSQSIENKRQREAFFQVYAEGRTSKTNPENTVSALLINWGHIKQRSTIIQLENDCNYEITLTAALVSHL